MSSRNDQSGRFGGPGSSHQDREHPGRNHQTAGHKAGGLPPGSGTPAGAPTNPSESRVSSGGGERDRHHAHTQERS